MGLLNPPVDLGALGADDISYEFGDDAAWVAVVDLGTYDANFADWDYGTLSDKVLAAMNGHELVAFGVPADGLRYRLTTRPPERPSVATMVATLDVTGPVALAGYTAMTMAAQFADHHLADEADAVFHLPEGRYRVDVHRQYEHEEGEQFANGELPAGDHLVLHFERTGDPAPSLTAIPWAAPTR